MFFKCLQRKCIYLYVLQTDFAGKSLSSDTTKLLIWLKNKENLFNSSLWLKLFLYQENCREFSSSFIFFSWKAKMANKKCTSSFFYFSSSVYFPTRVIFISNSEKYQYFSPKLYIFIFKLEFVCFLLLTSFL